MNNVVSKAVTRMQALQATGYRGATAAEYAILVAFIATILIAVVTTMGLKVANAFVPVNVMLP